MWDFLSHPTVQALLGVTVLFATIYVGIRVAKALRPATSKAAMNADSLAENFEEMRLQGDIDEGELRRIRAVLGETRDTRASE